MKCLLQVSINSLNELLWQQKVKNSDYKKGNLQMNRKQKIVLVTGFIIIAAALLFWVTNGAEIFTKTTVLVEKQDQLFGTTYKEWENRFVPGLDITAAFAVLSIFTSSVLIYLFKNKRKESV
jgi:hypothetical protein